MNYQNYIEMPFKKAFRMFPQYFISFPAKLLNEFFNDDDYIVRIDKTSEHVEIGYLSDNWILK